MTRRRVEILSRSLARSFEEAGEMRGRLRPLTGFASVAAGVAQRRFVHRPLGRRCVLSLVALWWGLAASDPTTACQSPDAPAETSVATNGSEIRKSNPRLDDPVKPGEPRELNFDDLKFDIEKGAEFKESMLSESLKKLDGQTVRLRGFVRPGFKQSGIKNFVLVRDNQECCFGPGAALYDCVMVKMSEDQAIEFTVRPITVVGTMQLKKYIGKDKKVWAIFRLNDTRQE